ARVRSEIAVEARRGIRCARVLARVAGSPRLCVGGSGSGLPAVARWFAGVSRRGEAAVARSARIAFLARVGLAGVALTRVEAATASVRGGRAHAVEIRRTSDFASLVRRAVETG